MAANFPRLLVATEAPPNAAGGGLAVIRQMLQPWPAENLLWWSCQPDRNRHFSRQVAAQRVARIPWRLYPHRRWRRPKGWLLQLAWLPWATRHLRNTFEVFKPDAVWVIPHAWAIPPLAAVLSQVQTGFHVTVQDFMDSNGYQARYGRKRCRRWAQLTEQLYQRATTRDATSHPMITELLAQTGAKAGQMLHAGLETEDFDNLAQPTPKRPDEIRIAYAGTVIAEPELVAFIRVLSHFRRQLPLPLWLDFFSDHSYRTRTWFDAAWMREHGNLPAVELSRALRECTWGFSPMELTDDNPRYNRFSFPTKFISYLAAGLPVISLGHPESSVVKMAAAYPVGLCLAENPENWSAQIATALSDPHPALKYRAAIQRCAAAEFDARRMREVLYACFGKCAERTRRMKTKLKC